MFNNNQFDYCNENNNSSYYNGQRPVNIPRPSQERILYEDILGYTNDTFTMQEEDQIDPMMDQNFLAFLSLLSASEPTPAPSSSLFLLQDGPFERNTSSPLLNATKHTKKGSSGVKRSSSAGSKIGQCEHPKHVLYRREKHTLMPPSETNSAMKTVPRRGRPPKGSKTTEFLFSTSPVDQGENQFYPIVELSVRPLPKRLETVVGKSNIKVCLTCLKRSDVDEEYIHHEAYIGPQQSHHKKKENNNTFNRNK